MNLSAACYGVGLFVLVCFVLLFFWVTGVCLLCFDRHLLRKPIKEFCF